MKEEWVGRYAYRKNGQEECKCDLWKRNGETNSSKSSIRKKLSHLVAYPIRAEAEHLELGYGAA